ncbi:hypothetical protein IWX50DRAFT_643940 [Phyllosticta citricarpa]
MVIRAVSVEVIFVVVVGSGVVAGGAVPPPNGGSTPIGVWVGAASGVAVKEPVQFFAMYVKGVGVPASFAVAVI